VMQRQLSRFASPLSFDRNRLSIASELGHNFRNSMPISKVVAISRADRNEICGDFVEITCVVLVELSSSSNGRHRTQFSVTRNDFLNSEALHRDDGD
jgi:hypothetical protein